MSKVELRITPSRSVLPALNEPQVLYALIELSAQSGATKMPRLPLNLCLVIDRSSSMRGERLQQVKQAAMQILDLLGDNESFALVTFNDRAEVVVSSQLARARAEIKRQISAIEAAGGTEMATGLALGVQELQRAMMPRAIHRLLLLTDGRTYGDESRCVEIARRAQARGIGITALGIGSEWNEDLLETIAARENSRTHYITSAADITKIFTAEVERMHSIFAQDVQVRLALPPQALVRSFDRVRPFIGSLPVMEEADSVWTATLGDWPEQDVQAFLVEVVIPSLPEGRHTLIRFNLRFRIPGSDNAVQSYDQVLQAVVRDPAEISADVDPTVKHWLERLVAYRLQASAWQAVEEGKLEEATRRLQMAGTRLFEAGQVELARAVQEEATRLLRSGQASAEGRKRIKYGTRGLIGREEQS
ncbi:MAG: VWA domain-containing protein [Chloroflexus sp.]|uniref:vWA domain-containing protein n=1 Tax=Chloroflexus sp. TaxID=1904827 RepID=UPI0021DBD5C2|nr:VWA domain-containing protein [Chloroflexus sp.]GIV89723.1 MAG: VWA domain-containing protein [Chloroflexus sp.]